MCGLAFIFETYNVKHVQHTQGAFIHSKETKKRDLHPYQIQNITTWGGGGGGEGNSKQ